MQIGIKTKHVFSGLKIGNETPEAFERIRKMFLREKKAKSIMFNRDRIQLWNVFCIALPKVEKVKKTNMKKQVSAGEISRKKNLPLTVKKSGERKKALGFHGWWNSIKYDQDGTGEEDQGRRK